MAEREVINVMRQCEQEMQYIRNKDYRGMCWRDYEPIFAYESACEALGHKWHMDCFVCAVCACTLRDCGYLEVEGQPYCEKDYAELMGDKCSQCKKTLTGQYLQALGMKFHADCFICSVCNTNLNGKEFMADNTKPICQNCYHDKYSPKCGGCGKPIVAEPGSGEVFCVKAFDKKWHKDCFCCSVCKMGFSNEEGKGALEIQNVLYCADHYKEKKLSMLKQA